MRALAVLLCILAFPVLEAWVLFALAERFGWWVAVWLVAAAIVGLLLIRIERFAWSLRVAASLARNRSPFTAFIASARTFVAGGLLIFPGVVSDALALLVLVWPLRRGSAADRTTPEPGVIDGEYRRERPPELPRRE